MTKDNNIYLNSLGCSEVFIFSFRKIHVSSILEFLVHCVDLILVNNNFRGLKDGSFNEGKVGVTNESSKEPDEGLLELIVALSGDIVVLEVLLSVESDLLSLDFSVLNINLVTNEDNRNVLADSDQVLVPLGNILVGDSRADVEHDNSAMSTNANYTVKKDIILTSSHL